MKFFSFEFVFLILQYYYKKPGFSVDRRPDNPLGFSEKTPGFFQLRSTKKIYGNLSVCHIGRNHIRFLILHLKLAEDIVKKKKE